MKRIASFLTVIVALVIGAHAQNAAVRTVIDDFKLKDIRGTERSLSELTGKNGTAIVFLSAECPVVRGYNGRINQMAAEYGSKGINFIGINSNASESLEVVRKHASEHYAFPVLIDTGNVVADKLGADVTPEIFYLDGKGRLLYHGAIDNDRSGKNATEQYLRIALDASLSGNKIIRDHVNAFGCGIRRVGE